MRRLCALFVAEVSMSRPKHEPEVIRARVSQIVDELRDGLRQMGLSDQEITGLALRAERRALEFALRPDGHWEA